MTQLTTNIKNKMKNYAISQRG